MKRLNSLLEIADRFSANKKNDNYGIFAILDTARDKSLYQKLIHYRPVKECLFDDAEEKALESVAPYLLKLSSDDPLLSLMAEEGFGKSWGFFIFSDVDIQTLASHYKKMIRAVDPDEKEYFFRFYDPRVLRTYFPVCYHDEKKYFLGPAENVIVEDPEQKKWLVFQLDVCFGI